MWQLGVARLASYLLLVFKTRFHPCVSVQCSYRKAESLLIFVARIPSMAWVLDARRVDKELVQPTAWEREQRANKKAHK